MNNSRFNSYGYREHTSASDCSDGIPAEAHPALAGWLLAFRQRQTQPFRDMDLNELITNLQGHLHAILPHNVDLKLNLEPSLGDLMADRSSIEEALVHLAVHARHAMPTGGTLTIETANIRRQTAAAKAPVSYALLRVTDTGKITSAAKDGLFEPLYSEEWDISDDSLELCAVYGIVKRAGGWISIYSQQGMGSSIEIFLPCSASTKAA